MPTRAGGSGGRHSTARDRIGDVPLIDHDADGVISPAEIEAYGRRVLATDHHLERPRDRPGAARIHTPSIGECDAGMESLSARLAASTQARSATWICRDLRRPADTVISALDAASAPSVSQSDAHHQRIDGGRSGIGGRSAPCGACDSARTIAGGPDAQQPETVQRHRHRRAGVGHHGQPQRRGAEAARRPGTAAFVASASVTFCRITRSARFAWLTRNAMSSS